VGVRVHQAKSSPIWCGFVDPRDIGHMGCAQ